LKQLELTVARLSKDAAENRKKLAAAQGSAASRKVPNGLVEIPMVQSTKLGELVIKPELFDGGNPEPRSWLEDFEEAIRANN